MLSVFIIVIHNITAHHHHYKIEVSENNPHDSDNKDEHNIFSFGQLDETYIHSDDQIHLSESFSVLFLAEQIFSFTQNLENEKTDFNYSEVIIPCSNFCIASYSLRGPPFPSL